MISNLRLWLRSKTLKSSGPLPELSAGNSRVTQAAPRMVGRPTNEEFSLNGGPATLELSNLRGRLRLGGTVGGGDVDDMQNQWMFPR